MKFQIKLAVLFLFLSILPSVFAVDATGLFSVGNFNTLASPPGRNSMPTLVYIDGKMIIAYSPGFNNIVGRESNDNGKSWGSPFSMGINFNGIAEVPPYMTTDPAHPHRLIGVFSNDQVALYNCSPVLAYSDNYGRSWVQLGNLPAKSAYSYAYYAITTSDGAVIVSAAYCKQLGSGTNFGVYCWVCDKGNDPSVLGNWHIGSDVGGSELDEPTIVEKAPQGQGRLLMTIRCRSGQMGFADSTDYGKSWTAVSYRGISNSPAPTAMARVSWSPSRILLCWADSPSSRNPLVVAVSEDEGQSWGGRLTVVNEGTAACYPYLAKGSGGEVCVGWWRTDVTGSGGSGNDEYTKTAVLVPTSTQGFEVTVQAYCDTEGKSLALSINEQITPFTHTVSSGSYTISAPSTDPNGDSFRCWSTGSTSTTLIVTSGDTYTAYYGVQQQNSNLILEIAFGIGASILVIALVVTRTGLVHTRGKRRRKR